MKNEGVSALIYGSLDGKDAIANNIPMVFHRIPHSKIPSRNFYMTLKMRA